jgi:hypothetical protein
LKVIAIFDQKTGRIASLAAAIVDTSGTARFQPGLEAEPMPGQQVRELTLPAELSSMSFADVCETCEVSPKGPAKIVRSAKRRKAGSV